ncbi:MAG: head GIN domain-containing protein, partial [Ferruginibacter sp.]
IVGSYHTIMVSGGIDLYLSQSASEGIAVSAVEDEYKMNIKTEIENNVLKIYYQGDKGWNLKDRKLKVYVSCKDLQQLQASGSSDINVSGKIVSPSLVIKLSGASDFNGAVEVSFLQMHLSGASDVTIVGTARDVVINSSGASDVNGFKLITESCTAKASGASDITLTVNKELFAQASGSSEIYYRGPAHIKEAQKSGSSSIGRKG